MRGKRLRHPGGVSWLTRRENDLGEWSIIVEPERLQIDTYHRGEGAHVHDPADHECRIPVGRVSADEAYRVVTRLLFAYGRIDLSLLVRDLGGAGG